MTSGTSPLWINRPAHAFTLVELLVGFAVFSVICMILLALTSNTSLVTTSMQASMARSSDLRGALDWMSADFRDAVIRDDLPPVIVESPDNDAFYFHVATDGYAGQRGITFVGYRIQDGHLERGAEGTNWSTQPVPFATDLASDDFVVNSQHPAYDVLAEHIFRMEAEFLMNDGTFRSTLTPESWQNVAAIAVTLATIDPQSLEKSSATPAQLAALLPGRSTSPGTDVEAPIMKEWSKLLETPGFYSSSPTIPAETKKGIQLRHRLFPIRRQ